MAIAITATLNSAAQRRRGEPNCASGYRGATGSSDAAQTRQAANFAQAYRRPEI